MRSLSDRLRAFFLITFLFPTGWLVLSHSFGAQRTDTKTIEELRAGKNFITTTVYTEEEDAAILKLFDGLRVADICDGMDKA